MPDMIYKTLSVTKVFYTTVIVVDGVASLVSQPSVYLRGNVSAAKALNILRGRHGENATVVITAIESGSHRFEMSFDDFIRYATVADDGLTDNSEQFVLSSPEPEPEPAPMPEFDMSVVDNDDYEVFSVQAEYEPVVEEDDAYSFAKAAWW